jgi:hypothetical protein
LVNRVSGNGSTILCSCCSTHSHAHTASDTEGNKSNGEEYRKSNYQIHHTALLSINVVNNKNWFLSIDGLDDSVITIRLSEESTLTVLSHESSELIEMLRFQRPNLLQNVEVNSLGARRSGQRTFVSPSVIQIGVFHHVSKLNFID